MSLSVPCFDTGALMQDLRRYVSIVFLATGAILFWLLIRALGGVFDLMGPGADRVLFFGVTASTALAFLGAVAVVAVLWKNPRVYNWVTAICDQFAKVTWPTGTETHKSSVTVIIFCVILGCILAVMDLVGQRAIDFVFQIFS